MCKISFSFLSNYAAGGVVSIGYIILEFMISLEQQAFYKYVGQKASTRFY